ncbi:major allergen Pru ar 1-like [Coffea eugenioides]|uniref:major allergen Pru ar 1-like n=1 Tax=Coffea eugenioides TaxID=49369 RepID=UPI000F60E865|nr:major allergen Pru ar 1-like [Coffea eugenioides]
MGLAVCFYLDLQQNIRLMDQTKKPGRAADVNLPSCYSVIESDALKEGIEKFTNEIKFEASPDGGSICKTTSSIYTKGDAKIPEGEIQGGRQRSLGLFKAVEAYLLANPDAYN